MPRHQEVTTCLKGGGPVSKFCTCPHCTLCVCSVCGAYEGGLTTDCPGEKVDFDKQQEVYETNLDFTDARGWHQGEPMKRRTPRFEVTIDARPRVGLDEPVRLPPEPPRADQRVVVAPTTDWERVDRTMALQHDLTQKAIAWVLADRACEELAAIYIRTQEQAESLRGKTDLDAEGRELLAQLEREKIDFHLADNRAQRCDDEFRQAARKLVAALEKT